MRQGRLGSKNAGCPGILTSWRQPCGTDTHGLSEMAQDRPRYSLMDLTMIVILAGLLLGLYQTVGNPGPQGGMTLLSVSLCIAGLAIWFITWGTMRAQRQAPTCQARGPRILPRARGT